MADSEILLKHDGLTPLQRLEGQSRLGSAHSRPASGATGYRPDGSGNVTSRPPRWISDKSWKQCQYLSTTLEAFQGLCMYILNCTEQWNTLAKNEDPYKLMMSAFTPETKEGKAGREKFAMSIPAVICFVCRNGYNVPTLKNERRKTNKIICDQKSSNSNCIILINVNHWPFFPLFLCSLHAVL